MKVVELFIDDEEDMAGGDAIAMVKNPAHESDFVAFNGGDKKEEEEQKEIILTDEEQQMVLQQFSTMGEDHQSFMMKGYYIKSVEPVDITPNFVKERFAATDINARPIKDVLDDRSVMDYSDGEGSYKVRFRYAVRPGRPAIINTTRQFCKDMINANKTYRLEDINKIVNGFQQYGNSSWGSAFFRFGGPNCNHVFVKIVYQAINDKKGKPTGKYKTVSEQDRGDAANIAGSNLNEATAANPSPQTIRRAGQGMFAKQDIKLDDYPQEARDNAKRVLAYLEESGNPNDCLTAVGKTRANQLANGENLSEDTLNRMKSFLSRHAGNERSGGARSYDDGCSNLALDAWGGLEILPWVEKKLKQFDQYKFFEELKKQYLMAGPVLIPEKLIYRLDPVTKEEYYVFFSKESVKKIAFKYMRDKNNRNTNIEHNQNQTIENVSLVESWIVDDPDNDKSNQYGFTCEAGTWFGVVDCSKNKEFYDEYVEKGKVLGFSLEGYFESKLVKFYENEKKHSNIDIETYILSEIENLLN